MALVEDISSRAKSSDAPRQSSSQSSIPSNHSQTVNYASNDGSQDTTGTHDTDRVFTPESSASGGSVTHANGTAASSQDSQLLALSQIAAAQERLAASGDSALNAQSKKRTADGEVKHLQDDSGISPKRIPGAHSRTTSAVSVASTATSRIGELSAELKTKLSYAMMKVNHGWQEHTINEVESLASHAASPVSSNSTIYGRYSASASPRVNSTGGHPGTSSAGVSPIIQQPAPGRAIESFSRETARTYQVPASPPTAHNVSHPPTLAPPATIQPHQPGQIYTGRRTSAGYPSSYVSDPYQRSPHTPGQPSPLRRTSGTRSILRTPNVDPIIFSPDQNAREQEALETLMFMSSPGNSGNMKYAFAASPQARTLLSQSQQRTALPTSRLGPSGDSSSQGRKTLPTARPQHVKRVGFEKSPGGYSDMEVDDRSDQSPRFRATPRRRTNGGGPRPSLPMPAGLSGPAKPRPPLQDEDIERMLDRVAADDSSDSEAEIVVPRERQPNGTGAIGV